MEPTATRPFEVLAERDGVLELHFPCVPYQWVGILPSTGNLLHPPDDMPKVDTPLGWARSNGQGGMIFHKNARRGLFTVPIATDISLKPGRRYRLTYGYRFLKANEGCFCYVRLTAKGPQGESVTNRDFRTPCVCDEPWLDGYCFLTVPAEWPSANLTVIVGSEGAECEVELTQMDVREAIEPMRNHPRHHGTAQQYPPVTTAEKAAKVLADAPIFEARIARLAERPVLEINGHPVPFTAYQGSYGPTARMFQELGYPFNFCHIPMAAGYRYRTLPARPFWQGKDKYDYGTIDETLAKFYSHAPGQPIMLQVSLYPYLGYTEDFPEARWLEHDGKPLEIEAQKGHYFHSITGKTYRREVGKALRKLSEYLKNSPWGRRIIGIHISDGGDGQWFDWMHSDWQHFHFDYSPDSQEELRAHIRRLYNNDIGRLRQAWNLPNAEFDTLELPRPDEWRPFFDTLLDKNDGNQRRLMDFASVLEDALVASIDWCHREFEEGLGRQVIGLVYFPHDSTAALLRSPHIDGLVSVPFYGGHRAPG
ncbi:MAG: hypothetical protein IJJ33_18655, partial [Victivallales bacterium]|nr:hypothetical protein [Victivallales bacterium]